MASMGSIGLKEIVLLTVFQAALPCSLRAQEPFQTVPSGPTPAAGTTNFERTKAIADAVVYALSKIEDLAVDVNYNRWLKENQAEIARAMPNGGGVLIRVQIAEEANTGEDMGRDHYFASAYIAATGKNQAEAEANFVRDNLHAGKSIAVGARTGYQIRSENRWLPSTSPPPPNTAMAAERLRVERLISQFEGEVQTERARLDLHWEIIQRLNQEVNNLRVDIGPEEPQGIQELQERAKATFDRERKRITDWKAAEQRAINNEQASNDNITSHIHSLRQILATYIANWRCPASLTLEECEREQNPARNIHLAERQASRNERARQQAEIDRQNQLLASRQARLRARIDSLPRQESILDRNAQKALAQAQQQGQKKEDRSKELKDKQDELQKKMDSFKDDDGKQSKFETFLKEARRVLDSIKV